MSSDTSKDTRDTHREPASNASADSDQRAELLRRLARLEEDITTLRRQLEDTAAQPAAYPDGRFPCLRLQIAGETYVIPIAAVQEIIRLVKLTPVSHAPRAVAGVFNRRGEVIPVLDAQLRFGFGPTASGLGTPIIVIDNQGRSLGIIVERVVDVIDVDASSLSPVNGPLSTVRCVAAIGHIGGEVIQILDVRQMLRVSEIDATPEQAVQLDTTDDSGSPPHAGEPAAETSGGRQGGR